MENAELLKRITINPEIYGGSPIIRGMRFRVSDIFDMLVSGMTYEEILHDFEYLELNDLKARMVFASEKFNYPTLHAA